MKITADVKSHLYDRLQEELERGEGYHDGGFRTYLSIICESCTDTNCPVYSFRDRPEDLPKGHTSSVIPVMIQCATLFDKLLPSVSEKSK